jgi:hypothetical protein
VAIPVSGSTAVDDTGLTQIEARVRHDFASGVDQGRLTPVGVARNDRLGAVSMAR